MPVTLTFEGLLVGVPAAIVAVALVRRRWRPTTSRGQRWRVTASIATAAVVVVAWPLVLVAAMLGGGFVVLMFLLGVTSPRRGPQPPRAQYWPRQGATEPHPETLAAVEERERRIAEDIADMARADEEQRQGYEWDQYRWGHRSVPPGGPEIW